MGIDSLSYMKEKPGIVVTGRYGTEAERVFDNFVFCLYDFYEKKGLLLATESFKYSQNQYFFKVFIPKLPNTECFNTEKENGEYGYDKGHDFPSSAHKKVQQKFGVYFNIKPGRGKGEEQAARESFSNRDGFYKWYCPILKENETLSLELLKSGQHHHKIIPLNQGMQT